MIDAERLSPDPVMGANVDRKGLDRMTVSTSEMESSSRNGRRSMTTWSH